MTNILSINNVLPNVLSVHCYYVCQMHVNAVPVCAVQMLCHLNNQQVRGKAGMSVPLCQTHYQSLFSSLSLPLLLLSSSPLMMRHI